MAVVPGAPNPTERSGIARRPSGRSVRGGALDELQCVAVRIPAEKRSSPRTARRIANLGRFEPGDQLSQAHHLERYVSIPSAVLGAFPGGIGARELKQVYLVPPNIEPCARIPEIGTPVVLAKAEQFTIEAEGTRKIRDQQADMVQIVEFKGHLSLDYGSPGTVENLSVATHLVTMASGLRRVIGGNRGIHAWYLCSR